MRSLLVVLLFVSLYVSLRGSANAAESVDFSKDVLPLLRRSCWECHGPKKQEGGLRLDQHEAAMRGGDSGLAIKAHQPDESELLRRISLPKGDAEVMPSRGEPLTSKQIAVIRQWIEQGANWSEGAGNTKHWAYVPPKRPELPAVRNSEWPRTPIDYFVLARLEKEGLSPAPRADRTFLLRRIYLDLIGLPPTPEELACFLQDEDPGAYERVVDRLLASDQFGVRWARPWLDYARYADSHGFQRDDFRDLWAYRDWVVTAFNADVPFDRFSIEQLAGDLLPNPTESQRVATGFHRSAPTNVEAGSDPEETRVNQVFDRVNTLGMVWLGTSLECAQCHDHKYDPFTMRDYYGLFACFNQTELEANRANPKVPGSIRFLGPEMELHDPQLETRRSELRQRLASLQREQEAIADKVRAHDGQWEKDLLQSASGTRSEQPLDVAEFDSLGGATHEILADKSVLLSGEAPDRDTYTIEVETKLTGIRGFKLEALTDDSLPGKGPGRGDAKRPNFVLNDFQLTISPADMSGSASKVAFSKASADFAQTRFPAANAVDKDSKSAWAIGPRFHEPHWAVFECESPIGFEKGTRLSFQLVQNFGASRTIGRLRLSAIVGDPDGPAIPAEVLDALKTPAEKRHEKQLKALTTFRLQGNGDYQQLLKRQKEVEAESARLKPATTLVMKELSQPRNSHIFERGDFRTPGERIEPSAPAVLNGESTKLQNRLDLANWLFRPDNPLVARVVVNRWWSEIFGHGIVTTPEDFGLKGEAPTHPDLLDWLAIEYQERQWSLKALLRSIVLSSTYQQSAKATPELLALDDKNLVYARGPRFRLDAEGIRDNALAVGGLLCLRTGGPTIRPYQPDGLWVKVGGQRYDYEVSPGDEQFRRGLYVVLKRAAPYPSFVNFDANNRMACRVRRPRSNTPLQALTLLNDPVYVDAAIAFARRVLKESPEGSAADRLTYALEVAVCRKPNEFELSVLQQLLDAQREAARDAPTTKQFAERWPPPDGISADEFKAWYAVCAALLNLDETITKP